MLVCPGVAGVAVGRWLDEHGPRLLMTAGSIVAVPLVLAWSQVRDLLSFYLIWIAIGIVFAAVNYGPAFATMIVWFRRHRSRALTLVTLFAGFASTVFVPLTAWLVSVQGWRQALVTLAMPLAVLVFLFGASGLGFLAFVLVFGAARGAETLVRPTIVAGLYGPRRIASIAAVLPLATTLTQAVSPVSLGAVYDSVGSYVPGF